MVRWYWAVCVPLAGLALAQAPRAPSGPDAHARLAAAFLSRAPEARYLRFLSWLGTPGKELRGRQAVLRFWLNSLSREPDLEFPREVPGSGGMLWWLDLRDYGWRVAAWQAVARREPYFREPWVSHVAAETLRRLTGVAQDPKTFHAEAIVRADWFFRETVETDRSQAYYDLLFGRERFPGQEFRASLAGGKWEVVQAAQDANFPKNEKDWEKVFGADVIQDFLRRQKLRVKNGAIVEEGASIVARQNRLLERLPIPAGAYWKTNDVTETAGRKDFAEQLFFDIQVDAGELIANLPNGAQAYLLVNGKGERVEVADNKVAIDSSDSRDRRVRTPGSCVVCHGPGINKPDNLIEQFVKDGLDIRFQDARKLREVKAFFLGWDRKLKADQETYAEFVQKTAGTESEKNASAFKRFRDTYDAPVDLAQAAMECGLSPEQFKAVALKSPHARPLQLVRGRTIPRATWERDTFREVMLLAVAKEE